MASRYRTNLTFTPEQKFAQKFLAKWKIRPPIDIQRIIKDYADLEEIAEPIVGSVDALVVGTPSGRPKIIASRFRKNERRYRFTLAHELGHIKMPWQIGTVFCHTDLEISSQVDSLDFWKIEDQANRFASELLLPTPWLKEMFSQCSKNPAHGISQIAKVAQTSLTATIIAITRICSQGMMVIVTEHGRVTFTSISPGSCCVIPANGTVLDYEQYRDLDCIICEHASVNLDKKMAVIYFPDETDLDDDMRSRVQAVSADTLKVILADLRFPEEKRQAIHNVINGIIGSLFENTRSSMEPGELFQCLKRRFINRNNLEPVCRHPKFNDFLLARAYELAARNVPAKVYRP